MPLTASVRLKTFLKNVQQDSCALLLQLKQSVKMLIQTAERTGGVQNVSQRMIKYAKRVQLVMN